MPVGWLRCTVHPEGTNRVFVRRGTRTQTAPGTLHHSPGHGFGRSPSARVLDRISHLCLVVRIGLRGPRIGRVLGFDCKTSTWFWIEFDDQQYGSYNVSDFDDLVHEYDILSLVERTALLKAIPRWMLEPGKPAENVFQPRLTEIRSRHIYT